MLSGSPTKLVSKTTSRKENPSPPTLPQHNQRLDIQPGMRFSRTRLTDAVHRRHSAFPAKAWYLPWV
jgi:hypothetical protein